MISVRELRIGNIALCKSVYTGEFELMVVDEIIPNKPYEYGVNGYTESLLKPIPLTEEILLKSGFEKAEIPFKDGSGSLFGYTAKGMEAFVLKYNPFNPVCFTEYHYGKKIEHLHQLQNLFFDLTGKELEIHL